MKHGIFGAMALLLLACGSDGGSGSTAAPSSSGGASSSSGSSSSGSTTSSSSSSSSGAASSGDAGSADAGTVGQTTGDALTVSVQIGVGLGGASPFTTFQVSVFDTTTSTSLNDAKVTVTPAGGSPLDVPFDVSSYQKTFDGLSVPTGYEISVVHPAGSRTGILFTPPSAYTIALDPPPKAASSSTLTWKPSNEPGVTFGGLVGAFTTDPDLPDSGSLLVPATAFPSGNKQVGLTLVRTRKLVVPGQLSVRADVIYRSTLTVAP